MTRSILKRLLALVLGITPGVLYCAYGTVGIWGGVFLIVTGGAVGLALTLPSVSPRRVLDDLAILAPLVWPIKVVVDAIRDETSAPAPSSAPPKPRPNPEWLTSDVLALARTIRLTGDRGLLPILADALMDGGCNEEALLARCRKGEGVREIVIFLLDWNEPSTTEILTRNP